MPSHLVLFPDPSKVVAAGLRALTGHAALNAALAGATPGTRQLAYNLLGAELIAVAAAEAYSPIIAGWRAHHRLITAARASLQPPYPTAQVDLGAYRVSSRQSHQIDVIINGAVRATLMVGLDIDITVARFRGTVRGGRLVTVHAGKSEASTTLTIDGVSVIHASLGFKLTAAIPLGDGIALL